MTSSAVHQTECPYCQHIVSVTDEELVIKGGYVRCDNCNRLFNAVQQLPSPVADTLSAKSGKFVLPTTPVASADENQPTDSKTGRHQPTKQATANKRPATKNQHRDKLISDDMVLFDDDTGVDEDTDSQPVPTHTITSSAVNPKQPHAIDNKPLDFELIDNFDALPTQPAPSFNEITTDKSNKKNVEDDAVWLNKLLEDEDGADVSPVQTTAQPAKPSRPVSKRKTPMVAPTDKQEDKVSKMLDFLGVGIKKSSTIDKGEYLRKLEQRLNKNTPAPHLATTKSGTTALVWGIGSVILLVLLLLQYVIFNIETLMKNPSTARTLTKVCSLSPIDCQLARANTDVIDSRVLVLTPTRGNHNQSDLVFTLKNTSRGAVLYPNLKITLRSGNEPKAQFILTPSQYISPAVSQMSAQQLKPVKLRIDYPRRKFEQVNIDMFY